MDPNRIRRLIWLASILLSCLISLAVGMAASRLIIGTDTDVLQNRLAAVQADLKEQTSSNVALTALLGTAAEKESQLEKEMNNSNEQLAATQNQLNQIQTAQTQLEALQLETQEIRAQYTHGSDKLEELRTIGNLVESHRLLLVEIRKEQPRSREDALSYWTAVKQVARKADPKLASPADKIILRIDNFFDWTEREPIYSSASSGGYADAYAEWQIIDRYTSGAVAYDEAVAGFTNEALLSVINQLDSLVINLE
mgnify:CR=1 FL=1